MSSSPRRFWVGVVSREHVRLGVAGGFIQLNHGKKAPLQRMHGGDGLVMYSPRASYPDGAPLQCFTAIGAVDTGEAYQVEMSEGFALYRVDVTFSSARAHCPGDGGRCADRQDRSPRKLIDAAER